METERPHGPQIGSRAHTAGTTVDPLTPLYRRSMFWTPEWQAPAACSEHVPFAFWLTDVLRPGTVVAVGAQPDVLYAAICQAVKAVQSPTRCFAVASTDRSGRFAAQMEAAERGFSVFHDPRYGTFSTLVRSTAEEAADDFADGSVDLLYIDAAHGAAAARRDFALWRPKIAANAVVLLHDVNVREMGFDGSLLWSEVNRGNRHFTFPHGQGLGVAGFGADAPLPLRLLFEADENPDLRGAVREAFVALGRAARQAGSVAIGPPDRALSIAVVIPLHNGRDYIELALRSVFAQTLPPDEVIVVDDGSTDDGAAIVERLMRDHPIVLLRKPNGGQSSARNFGVAHSRSELIALLDQDDEWYANHLERLSAPFREARVIPLGWAYSGIDLIDAEGRLIARPFETARAHPKRSIVDCLREDMTILPTCAMLSRDAFERVGGFDERLSGYEDDDLFLRLFRAGYDNVYIGESLGRWRSHGGSATWTLRMARSRVVYMKKLLEMFPDEPKHHRFYTSQVIMPRFLPLLTDRVRRAVASGDGKAVREAAEDVRTMLPYVSRKQRALLTFALFVVRFRLLRQLAYAFRPALLPIWRGLHG